MILGEVRRGLTMSTNNLTVELAKKKKKKKNRLQLHLALLLVTLLWNIFGVQSTFNAAVNHIYNQRASGTNGSNFTCETFIWREGGGGAIFMSSVKTFKNLFTLQFWKVRKSLLEFRPMTLMSKSEMFKINIFCSQFCRQSVLVWLS